MIDLAVDVQRSRSVHLLRDDDLGSALGSVADTRAWQETIAGSELLVLPGESYHVAATHAEAAAAATLAFLQRQTRAGV